MYELHDFLEYFTGVGKQSFCLKSANRKFLRSFCYRKPQGMPGRKKQICKIVQYDKSGNRKSANFYKMLHNSVSKVLKVAVLRNFYYEQILIKALFF